MIFNLLRKINKQHVQQVVLYGIVGALAWLVQTIVYICAVHEHVFPSIAMIFGNFAGFLLAYFGHMRFTFAKGYKFSHREFIKFLITSIIGLIINVGGVRIITKVLLLNPHYGIIPTIFTPGVTFLISKFWAFR